MQGRPARDALVLLRVTESPPGVPASAGMACDRNRPPIRPTPPPRTPPDHPRNSPRLTPGTPSYAAEDEASIPNCTSGPCGLCFSSSSFAAAAGLA